ncbi:MAG TPA: methionyl-tRNA formyltransferase [Candidatus Eisenbacteria bacterium]|nr:methionyl-tRNA formyltransferase [Candidatus Eisenbacteria bacterium]
MNTVFFGASSYVIPLIEFLSKSYDLQLVVTTEQKPTDAVIQYCTEQNIPYLSVTSLKDQDTRNKIQETNAQFAVLADFRLMVKEDVLNLFPKGIINIHPSLLPEYRGPTPGVAALLDGRDITGVSLMILDTQLDHGPLIGQVSEHILPSDTAVSLYEKLFAKGAQLLAEKLPLYLEGKIEPKEQDHSKATYTDFLNRDSGYIDIEKFQISNFSPRGEAGKFQIENAIRAFFPWPTIWTLTTLHGKKVRIKFLPDKKVQVEGKNPMSYKDFINGYEEGKEILGKLWLL